jgi:hypothetical protein
MHNSYPLNVKEIKIRVDTELSDPWRGENNVYITRILSLLYIKHEEIAATVFFVSRDVPNWRGHEYLWFHLSNKNSSWFIYDSSSFCLIL